VGALDENEGALIDGALDESEGALVDGTLDENEEALVDGALDESEGALVDGAVVSLGALGALVGALVALTLTLLARWLSFLLAPAARPWDAIPLDLWWSTLTTLRLRCVPLSLALHSATIIVKVRSTFIIVIYLVS